MTDKLEQKIKELEKKKKQESVKIKEDWIPKDRKLTDEEQARFEKEMEDFLS